MIRTRRHAALAALAVLCMAVAGFSSASFGAGSANPGNAFSAAADWVAPVVALTSPADGGSTNTTPTFSGTAGTAAGDLSTVTVKVYSGSSATGSPIQTLTTTQSGGAWSVPASPALAEGTYTARAQQSDSSGNIGTSASSTFVIDRTAPAGLTLTAPLNGSATNNTTPTFSGVAGNAATDSATVTVKVYSGSDTSGTLVQTRSATRSGSSWSISATTLAQGTYTAQAQQSDTAGNSSSSSTTTFKVDTTAPTVPSSVIAATS
ncbi:MAG: large repetitive protein, partial [Solirubrobacteraceae bacterium]|nr:large repetitive protein [Solirubrobacteraceae bacterium]